MKAITLKAFGDSSNFELTNLPVPAVGPNDVLVQIKATAFNPIDYQMRKGLRESALMRSPILGREFSGVVVGTGSNAKKFTPGDAVVALAGSLGSNGTYAEYIAINQKLLAKKPAGIFFEEAAAIPSSGLTAWETITRAGIKPDDSIFIAGATGGVGRFLIKLLKLNGINDITATAGNPQSVDSLIALGVDSNRIVNYNADNLTDAILKTNGRQKFDYVADLAGGTITEAAASVLKINGTYLDVTFLSTEEAREILFDSACNIYNIAAFAYGLSGNLEWYGNTLEQINNLISTGQLSAPDVNVIGGLSVATVQEAHRLMESNQIFGKKIVMSI
ncbi:quinone oxidoreductase family protein [Mucilaginibacter pedocola]|uniref:Enoyl reductase (ER) domain-containing protein n=1 Tax=Mucilaginibacter pedocola TaxID=1792845 RepID=A0A1S9PAB9_9SPHI|nr:NADP-dependent oxidoreductase [Mucilaginibacter pedocola]OOQ57777.1 hypothetical protein BC343_13395 [Mucilaginibacter pedocola]